jgi:hypothetical protein
VSKVSCSSKVSHVSSSVPQVSKVSRVSSPVSSGSKVSHPLSQVSTTLPLSILRVLITFYQTFIIVFLSIKV